MGKDIKRATGDKLAAAFDGVGAAVARKELPKQEQQKRKGK
jgi:hypothetical protein